MMIKTLKFQRNILNNSLKALQYIDRMKRGTCKK